MDTLSISKIASEEYLIMSQTDAITGNRLAPGV